MQSIANLTKSVELIKSGKLDEGLVLLNGIIEETPDNIDALSWTGMAYHLAGQYSNAVTYFKKIIALDKQNLDALKNLGAAYIAMGLAQEAEHVFSLAHDQDPTNADINYNLGFFAEMKQDYAKAITYYQATITANPLIKEAYIQLGNVLNITGQKKGAFIVFCEAEKQFSDDPDIQFCRGKMAESMVPGWHIPMLADQDRNNAFQAAIEKVVKPGDVVLDIGTGSGLLSMMAVRAGAKHVYACEMVDAMAMVAQEIVDNNGYGDQITIIDKSSFDLVMGQDLPEKVDVIVSETFDFALVGEGALNNLRHAKETFLKAGGRIIPESAKLNAVILECPFLRSLHPIGDVNGFDLSPMKVFANPLSYKDARITLDGEGEYRVLTEPFTVAEFDFKNIPQGILNFSSDITGAEDGEGDSVHMWFDLHLCEGVDLSTRIRNPRHHWRQPTQSLLQVKDVKAGESFKMHTQYGAYFHFQIED